MQPVSRSFLLRSASAWLLGGALLALAPLQPARANAPEASLGSAIKDLQTVGKARLRFLGFDVYDASLWALPGFDAQRYGEQRFGLELSYLRDFKGSDIAERSIKEMRGIGDFSSEQAERWQKAMGELFPDVRRGDRITGVHLPGSGARFYYNGQLRGEVADTSFARLFFGIWLSPKTSQPRMRDTLLQPLAPAGEKKP